MTDPTNPAAAPQPAAPGEAAPPKKKRGGGKRGGRPQEGADQSRQSRPRSDKSGMNGFGDGIERAVCVGVDHAPPRVFPANHRTDLAVAKLVGVARTATAILLCDGRHAGPHVWPNGDVVDEDSGATVDMQAVFEGRETMGTV